MCKGVPEFSPSKLSNLKKSPLRFSEIGRMTECFQNYFVGPLIEIPKGIISTCNCRFLPSVFWSKVITFLLQWTVEQTTRHGVKVYIFFFSPDSPSKDRIWQLFWECSKMWRFNCMKKKPHFLWTKPPGTAEQRKQMIKPTLKQPRENNQMKKENWDLIIPLVLTAPQSFLAANFLWGVWAWNIDETEHLMWYKCCRIHGLNNYANIMLILESGTF